MTVRQRLVRAALRPPLWAALQAIIVRRIRAAAGPAALDRITLLALNPNRFRHDLELLEATGRFRVLRVPFETQAALIPYFYGPDRTAIFRPPVGSPLAAGQAAYRRLLTGVIRRLVATENVRVVVGAAIHYKQDLDWGAAAHAAGIPYVVLHRENLATAPLVRAAYVERYREIGPFQGDHIVVHNEMMKSVLVDSGFAGSDDVSVAGAMRMDRFIERLGAQAPTRHQRLVLFSFHHAMSLGLDRHERVGRFDGAWSADGSAGWVRLFDAVHGAVARFASSNPDVEVVVKLKWGGERWHRYVEAACERSGVDPAKTANLVVDDASDAQDLILRADVVTGFASTTLLESALAGRPVIVPHFEEAADPVYEGRVPFRDVSDIFDVAYSLSEYERLLDQRMADPAVDPEVQRKRRSVFSAYVSPEQGGATEAYVDLLDYWARRAAS